MISRPPLTKSLQTKLLNLAAKKGLSSSSIFCAHRNTPSTVMSCLPIGYSRRRFYKQSLLSSFSFHFLKKKKLSDIFFKCDKTQRIAPKKIMSVSFTKGLFFSHTSIRHTDTYRGDFQANNSTHTLYLRG